MIDKLVFWSIGNGETIDALNSCWIEVGTLLKYHLLINVENQHHCSVVNLADGKENWNRNRLRIMWPYEIIDKVATILPPRKDLGEDVRMWGGSANGNFSTATMYDNLTHTGGQDIKWKKIWRIKVPERIRMFIWIMHWNALKTNQFVAQKHLRDPDCTECRGKDESQIHVTAKSSNMSG